MSSLSATAPVGPGRSWSRFAQEHAWTVGVWLLFAAMFAWYASRLPVFTAFEVTSLVVSAVPVCLLAMAQSVVILGGGIDLSAGAMLVLVNCVSAQLMQTTVDGSTVPRSFIACAAIALVVIAGTVVLGMCTGWAITASGVPDIIVTLATSFVLFGLALWVLPSPGGATNPSFARLMTGDDSGLIWWRAALWIGGVFLVVWIPLRRSRVGLSVYAMGSNANAAYLSGVNLRRTRVVSYALGAFFAGLAGISTTMINNGAQPNFANANLSTLNSVAAAVLGGVALTGGVGGTLGPIAAALALSLLGPILTNLQNDISWMDPNMAEIVKGLVLIFVVMLGGWARSRRKSRA